MDKEIVFSKYKTQGPNYHYRQINKKNLKEFNAYVFARYALEIDLLRKIFNESKKDIYRILDIGCGDGVLIYLIVKKFRKKDIELFGIDSSEIAIEVAKEKIPLAEFKIANLYDLPFEENYFDIIISSDVIEHVSEANKMLSEIRRVGKKGSYILIGTPIKYTEKPLDRNHYHEFFPDEYKRVLDDFFQGIKIIQSHSLTYALLYNKVSSIFKYNFLIYRAIINFIAIFLKKNPFLKPKNPQSGNEKYSYMFGVGTIKKVNQNIKKKL